MRDLCAPLGYVSRVFVVKDRETWVCKGFAFVSFHSKEDAEKAMAVLDGRGYGNLILKAEWSERK